MTKRVAITGSSGLIGGALRAHLVARGDEVIRLVRRPTTASDELQWDPARADLEPEALAEVDAVVNLAGAGVGDRRWTEDHKRAILSSRIDATTTVARAVAAEHARSGRAVRLVNASAVGFYGDRGDEPLTEQSPPGDDFLASVVVQWEAAAEQATGSAPVAMVRTGLVMAPDGGAFERLLLLARLGLGGPLGSGREWWPWITLADTVRAVTFLIDHTDQVGPFNLAAPGEARQVEIAHAFGRALHRPAILPAPRLALRAVVGEFADSILASQRVRPARLAEAGFTFEHPDLDTAVRWTLQR
ncbi:TIGR01777 family oxidoreductase [Intrasporangium calvum]|uniref:TIGR01777 family oxidoreductase n=1 Tax=Intrasporangium calvum TaxID=53358 RepID=A0ABT5GJH0_9MICO|nr:TIGR01777 family oxidoreductase [Intrasporangium calvum]MDC5698390.1 TIGR01777 family oxidoreductase [Intrasporangium calvum]